jgi:hypothetical protein
MFMKRFFRDCYMQTGWLPMYPLSRGLEIGDACQLRQGRFQPLLNIGDDPVQEPIAVSRTIELDPADWRLSHGVRQTYCTSRSEEGDDGRRYAGTTQELAFEQPGDYMFHAHSARLRLLTNWNEVKEHATLKLTQLHYGFRDLYLVTGIVSAAEWALAVADRAAATLETSAILESADSFSLLSHATATIRQCQGIHLFERDHGKPAHFFQARKLVLSDATRDRYLGQLLTKSPGLRPADIHRWLDGSLLNLVKTNELNLNTSIGFFDWADMTLDDVELLAG